MLLVNDRWPLWDISRSGARLRRASRAGSFNRLHRYNYRGDWFGQEPVVQVEDAEKFTNIMPDAKSAITIGYHSPDKEDKEE
jgi:hypothetical protein